MICHLVVPSFDATRGGLEQSAIRVAGHLAAEASAVHAYSLHPDSTHPPTEWPSNIEPVPLNWARAQLCAPLNEEASRSGSADVFTTEFLLLRSAVKERIRRASSDRHLVVSFFVSHAGFTAQHLSDSLKLPHLASVRGSDFTRDFRQPTRLSAIAYVLLRSQGVVTTNLEQARTLDLVFGIGHKATTIYNSANPIGIHKQPPVSPRLRVVADCGYSFKKGTIVLLRAVEALLQQGLPLHLTVVGNTEAAETSFWKDMREHFSSRQPEAFQFHDWVARSEVQRLLETGHIYASATLGEGSSNARLNALAYGIPIATTECGTVADIASDADHVSLCAPGDEKGFYVALAAMSQRILAGNLKVRDDLIRHWRQILAPSRERQEWQAVVKRTLSERE